MLKAKQWRKKTPPPNVTGFYFASYKSGCLFWKTARIIFPVYVWVLKNGKQRAYLSGSKYPCYKPEEEYTSMQKENSYDTPSVSAAIVPGSTVEKVGRTTGRTVGKVRAQISGPFMVRYKMAELEIDIAVFYEPMFAVESTTKGGFFSRAGDSGSLVTTLDANNVRTAVGLVFAGDDHPLSYVLPLQPILNQFGVALVSGHNV